MAVIVHARLAAIFLLLLDLTTCSNSQGVLVCCSWSAGAGFISLACGHNREFQDNLNNLTWIPDYPYIDGYGRPVFVPRTPEHLVSNQLYKVELYSFLRYFDNTKSCYRLRTVPGTIYLVRGGFSYGDYDAKASPPSFNVSLDATLVHEISLIDGRLDIQKEAETIFRAEAEEMNYCLIAVSASMKPVISSLELRPLANFVLPDGILETIVHLDAGNVGHEVYRYPDDDADIIWTPETSLVDTVVNRSKHTVPFEVPIIVMDTAATADHALIYIVNATNLHLDFYVCLHFLELEPLNVGARVFDIVINDRVFQKEFEILSSDGTNMGVKMCFNVLASPILNISLIASNTSQKGPLLNALEAYHIIKRIPGTAKGDVEALLPLKMYSTKLQWSGDPCLPLRTNWDGIFCKKKDESVVVAEVQLDGKGLNGSVPTCLGGLQDLEVLLLDENMFCGEIPDFSPMKNLTTLRLDNNNLNGTIPEYLAHMPKLSQLHLDNNNLEGYIPSGLRELANFTFSGNQLLLGWLLEKKHGSTALFFVGGFAGGFAILLFVMAGCLCFVVRKRKMKLIDVVAFIANAQLKETPKYVTRIAKDAKPPNHIRRLSLKEVASATNYYKTMIGEGGFGAVFYGTLSGQAVAVKARSSTSIQGAREFNTELNLDSARKPGSTSWFLCGR